VVRLRIAGLINGNETLVAKEFIPNHLKCIVIELEKVVFAKC
jgi:hypothetical protein